MADTNIQNPTQTSQMVAREAGIGSVKAFFESQKGVLAAVLPKHVSPDRMLKIALGALRTTPKLMQCKVESLLGGVVQCSQLGLEPNTPLGHAYLIPFENRQKGITEVQIVLGYKGLIDLARRSGQVVSIAAHEVCERDHFEYSYGLDERLEHRPAMGERGKVIAFYAVAKLKDGGHAFEVMSKAQIEEIRDASQNYKFARDKAKTVWGQHFVEMGRKTVLRRLFKYLPVSIELATASALDDLSARGVSQGLDVNTIDGEFTVMPDTADEDGAGGDQDDDDQQRGEQAEQQKPKSAPAALPAPDAVRMKLQKAEDVELLDAAADFIREVRDDGARAELEQFYRARRAQLEGNADGDQADQQHQSTPATTTRPGRSRAAME